MTVNHKGTSSKMEVTLQALGAKYPEMDLAHVGITGYPESHPTIHDDLTVQSMWDKRRYATHVVSNLTFDPDMLADLCIEIA